MRTQRKHVGPYVLVTAAYNEQRHIGSAVESVLNQTLLPLKWVIVSDNSTDETDQIVQAYAEKHHFIRLLRVTKTSGHNFGAKVIALRKGEELLRGLQYGFIGNLDADISLDDCYFENLIRHFKEDPDLGIASGFVYEDEGNGFRNRWFNSTSNVPHAAQLVRRDCYEAIGGYAVLKYGGEDWYAQTCAKINGWKVEALPQLKIFHHRRTGAGDRPIKNAFRLGRLDYSFGSDPLFEVVKCARKLRDKPLFVTGLMRLLGFAWCYLSGEKKAVPDEFAAFLRKEQRARFFKFFSRQTSQLSLNSQDRQVP